MPRRLLAYLAGAGSLLGTAPALADVSLPNTRVVPSEAVFTGLNDFPAYRFVIAVSPYRSDPEIFKPENIPPPSSVREGEPVAVDKLYFQELRAIPADTPDPVTDAWVLASKGPSSGVFTRHPLHVATTSSERVARASFHVRQIQGGWISLELLSNVAVMGDGSERPLAKVIPVSFAIASFDAPPGWQLFLMPDPSWAGTDPPLPATRCQAGDVLPLSPGPRALVAVEGSPLPDGSLAGKSHLSWARPLDAWMREEVSSDSAAVAMRVELEVLARPGSRLEMTLGKRYQDARGRWFHDADLTLPVEVLEEPEWWPIGAGGALAVLTLAGAFAWRRRRRTRAIRPPPHAPSPPRHPS